MLRAEWDPGTRNVIRIENDDPQPGAPSSGYTGAERSGQDTKWYPFEVDYPETFVPRFLQLLGPSRMVLTDGVVHQEFPNADYSEEAVRAALAEEVKRAARLALGDTDWYFTRQLDTGEEIPDDVRAARREARAAIAAKLEAVATASPSGLLDFDTMIVVEGHGWTAGLAPAVPTAPRV